MTNHTYDFDKALEHLSQDALATFEEVSSKASRIQQNSNNAPVSGCHDIFASNNSFTGGNAHDNYNSIREEGAHALKRLKVEPAISKIVFEDESGEQHTRYIARVSVAGVSTKAKNLMSKRHPLASLASMPVGDSKFLSFQGKDQELFVVETISFFPEFSGTWDSVLSIYKHENSGTKEIKSLRALLESTQLLDSFDALFEEEDSVVIVEDGISHQILTAMGLRDQPILDKFQDEIFREDLNTQKIILGPPGTGKTTTLIQRLGQKRDVEYLDEAEKKVAVEDFSGISHENSWVMFTPTDLLKHYVKEAFSKEGIPASEDKIKTWLSHRNYIARNVYNLLQIGSDSGKFILKSNLSLLDSTARMESISWFEKFKKHHQERLFSQLTDGIDLLEKTEVSLPPIVEKLSIIVNAGNQSSLVNLYEKLLPIDSEIHALVEREKESVDKKIRETLRPIYAQDKAILEKLAAFLDQLSVDSESEEDESFDDETEHLRTTSKHNNKTASIEYIKAIKALARQTYLKRSLGKSSRAYAIIKWLDERIPTRELLLDIGCLVTFQNGLRRFENAHKRYLLDIAASYKSFRKESYRSRVYYQKLPDNAKDITGDELDSVLLLTLENMHELLASKIIRSQLDNRYFSYLKQYSGTLKNQVLVDEATDFSIIQLACMRRLCHPDTQSFFACGDFNQRIAITGVTRQTELEWFLDKSDIKRITAVYRQSRKLNSFAKQLLEITGGDIESLGTIPDDVNHDGVSPVLAENTGINDVCPWLAKRIQEVNLSINTDNYGAAIVPTIAILVKNEAQVEAIASELNTLLEDINLSVEACKDGKSLGDSSGVRVFAIEHIKGLEFEAVFFVDIDSLAELLPEVYEKYLYVGVTRAATYLGITCTHMMPAKLEPLKEFMVTQFSS